MVSGAWGRRCAARSVAACVLAGAVAAGLAAPSAQAAPAVAQVPAPAAAAPSQTLQEQLSRAAQATCGASLVTFAPGRMDWHHVSAQVPIKVTTSQEPHGVSVESSDVVAIPQASLRLTSRYLSWLDLFLARRSGALTVAEITLEPPNPPSSTPGHASGLRTVRQVVVSTHRGEPDPRPGPSVPAIRDTRGFSSYSLESGRLVRRSSPSSTAPSGSMRGFGDLRAMTLISRTGRHDVLLANATNGRLYTITIPATRAFTPKRTLVRASGWGGFDRLIAEPCGRSGTVVIGFDARHQGAWLYRVGFARGTATPITRVGRVPGQWVGARTAPVVTVSGPDGGERIEGG